MTVDTVPVMRAIDAPRVPRRRNQKAMLSAAMKAVCPLGKDPSTCAGVNGWTRVKISGRGLSTTTLMAAVGSHVNATIPPKTIAVRTDRRTAAMVMRMRSVRNAAGTGSSMK